MTTTLAENLASLKAHVSNLETELADLTKGRKASAARARKLLQTLKVTSHTMRKQIVEHVKTIPVKAKAVKVPVVEAASGAVVEVPEAEAVVPEAVVSRKRTKRVKD